MKGKVRFTLLAAMLIALSMVFSGCSNKAKEAEAAGNGQEQWPETLVFGYLPNEDSADDNRKKGRDIFMKDMTEYIGIPVDVIICDDYNAVIETMRNEKVHIAQFGPFSYIIASERSNAQAVCVTAKSMESAYYNSYLITHADSGIEKVEDIRGKTMSFVDPASTSGNLVPRTMIVNSLGVSPEDIDGNVFASVQFAGNHQNSFIAAANRSVDVSAVSSSTYKKSIEKGLADEKDIRILVKSDNIPSSPIAVYGGLPDDLKEKIIDFFHTYDNDEYFTLSGSEGKKFIAMEDSKYDYIRNIAKSMNLSPEELLK